jgi:sugar/nucleoside kinase (ribokinase family)
MTHIYDVLALGAVAVDDLVYLDGYPGPDSKAPIMAEQRSGGGLAGTMLVAASRLGSRAAYLGVLGDDELSRFTVAELERERVDCRLVRRHPDARPVHSVILVDRLTGLRTVLFNLAGVTPPAVEDIDAGLMACCRVLFVDSTMPPVARHAVGLARAAGAPVVADLEHPDRAGVPELAREVNHLIVGANFAARLTGESDPIAMVVALWHEQRAAVVVTAGEQGCWYAARETGARVRRLRALPVTVVDTTGCGDVFHGAYASRLAAGDSVARCVAAATVAAGLKATRPGGRAGIPDWPTVKRCMEADLEHDEPA